MERGANTGMGHHTFSFDSRADHLRCRRDLILGHRQVRARCTAREFAQDSRGAGLSGGNPATGAPISWRRILVNSPGAQPNRAWQSAGAGRQADGYSSRRQTS
jgi:hypothetical protein